LSRLEICFGRVVPRGRVAIVELDHHVASVHRLVVAHEHVQHLARHARRDIGDVALDERIVGRLLAAAVQVDAGADERGNAQKRGQHDFGPRTFHGRGGGGLLVECGIGGLQGN
jgi:hypothetical protein